MSLRRQKSLELGRPRYIVPKIVLFGTFAISAFAMIDRCISWMDMAFKIHVDNIYVASLAPNLNPYVCKTNFDLLKVSM